MIWLFVVGGNGRVVCVLLEEVSSSIVAGIVLDSEVALLIAEGMMNRCKEEQG